MSIETSMKGRKALAAAAGLAMVAGSVGTAYAAPVNEAQDELNAMSAAQVLADSASSSLQRPAVVEGIFGFSQTAAASAEQIAQAFRGSQYLCGAGAHEAPATEVTAGDASAWSVKVTGAVKSEFSTTFGAVVDAGTESRVIGCACAGNPAGGLAAVNAEVSGISVQRLIAAAAPENDANAVTFTGADGTQVTVPLWYVFAHSAILADEIAGEPVSASMGATVQLWIDGAPASYFVKDVVSVEVACEDETPEAPSESADRSALPNATVTAAA